jgi:hypothetical protein
MLYDIIYQNYFIKKENALDDFNKQGAEIYDDFYLITDEPKVLQNSTAESIYNFYIKSNKDCYHVLTLGNSKDGERVVLWYDNTGKLLDNYSVIPFKMEDYYDKFIDYMKKEFDISEKDITYIRSSRQLKLVIYYFADNEDCFMGLKEFLDNIREEIEKSELLDDDEEIIINGNKL